MVLILFAAESGDEIQTWQSKNGLGAGFSRSAMPPPFFNRRGRLAGHGG